MPVDPKQEQPAEPVGEVADMGYVDAPAHILGRRLHHCVGVQRTATYPVDVADVTSHELTTSPTLEVRLSDAQARQRRAVRDGKSL